MIRNLAALALAATVAGPALADGAALTLGFGAKLRPDYPGSDSYGAGASGFVRLHGLSYGGVTVGNPNGRSGDRGLGWGLRGAFATTPERKAADHPELTGLKDVDFALELGLGLGYEAEHWRAFFDLRKGVTGHYGTVGVLGLDAKLPASDQLTISFGPRLTFASQGYFDTYYGISAAESVASGLPAFAPKEGLLSAGLELTAAYDFGNDWGIEGKASYGWLQGDAKDSPITQMGSDEQGSVSLMLTRRISFGF